MDTLQIQIPEGHEIDKENSDLEKGIIKFKRTKNIRFIDDENAFPSGYYINDRGNINEGNFHVNWPDPRLSFATYKQAQSCIAFGRLSHIIANDKRFGGPITDEEWNDNTLKYVIERGGDYIKLNVWSNMYHFLAFHSFTQRELFLQENEDLIKQYFML